MFAERLQKFSDHEIGLERGQVRLVPYNSNWKRLFSDEAYFVFDQLRDESLRLYHCGSTCVDGLDSKPVIDILGSVSSLEELDRRKDRLEAIGYEYKGEYGIKGRRYCVLYNPEKTIAYVHVHIFKHDSIEIQKHLKFRDHLRKPSDAREVYLKHKRHLVNEIKIDRSNYSDAKNEVIAKLQFEADRNDSRPRVLTVLGAAEGHKNTSDFLRELFAEHTMEVIDLVESPIDRYVYSKNPSDAFQSIVQKALEADLLVLATPVYWYAMSGVMKDFVDWFSNLMSGEHKHLGEALYGKKVRLVSTGYDLNLPLGFEVPFSGTSIYFGMDYVGATYKSVRT